MIVNVRKETGGLPVCCAIVTQHKNPINKAVLINFDRIVSRVSFIFFLGVPQARLRRKR